MKIKYLPTGIIFDLPVEECKRIYKESPFNYEVLDGAFKDESKSPQSTVAKKVLGDEDGEGEKKLEDLTVPELKKLCDEKEIEYTKSVKKADLIALLENAEEDEEDGEDEQGDEDGEGEDNENGETDGSDKNEEENSEESEE